MTDVLKGLHARRMDLERRIAAARLGDSASFVEDAGCHQVISVADLQLRLQSVIRQIEVYNNAGLG